MSLAWFGTASAGGVLPELTESVPILATGNCGALTAVVTSSLPTETATCGTNPSTQFSFAGVPWLAPSMAGSTLTFTALSNPATYGRIGTVTITAATGATATVTVSEAGDTEATLTREVRTLYQALLGRDPDPAGFAFWTSTGVAGLGQMADSFLTSPEAFNSDFAVVAAYQAGTGQLPTYAQFTAAIPAIRNGTRTIPGLYLSLAGTGAEATQATTASLYQNLLNRPPDPVEFLIANIVGLGYTFQALVGFPAGASSATAAIGSAADEFQSIGAFHTDHTNALYIATLYYTILGRDPDAGGLQFWGNLANSGGPGILFDGLAGAPTRIQILGPGTPGQGFLGSGEFASLFCQ